MRRSQLPLTAIRAFEAAGRHENFRRAAEELGVSETAIGRQVRELEDLLGIVLFSRKHRTVRLEETGRRLQGQLTEGLDAIDLALTTAMVPSSRDEVVVSVEPALATLFLLPRLERFASQHPGIEVRVETSAVLADLRSAGPNLAIRHGLNARSWPNLESRHLFDMSLTPAMAPALARSVEVPGDLIRFELLHDDSRRAWSKWFAAAGVSHSPLTGPVFSSSSLAIKAAQGGQGAALANRRMVAPIVDAGLIVLPFALEIVRGAYWLVAREFLRLTDAEATFCDWLEREMSGPS